MRIFERLPLLMLFIVAAIFGVKQLIEPDLWWQLRTGEWMLENMQVTKSDPFSYTHLGANWVNVKWFYEVLIALLAKIGGPTLIPILQSLFNVLMVWAAAKTYKAATGKEVALGFILTGYLALVAMDFRMIARPEMVSHLGMAAMLAILVGFRNSDHGGKGVFWLIPIQAVWANMHEAFGMGPVVMLAFAAGCLVEQKLLKAKPFSLGKWKRLGLAIAAAIGAICLNPRGFSLLLHPLEIYRQLGNNKFTMELLGMESPLFWTVEAYIATGLAALAAIFISLSLKKDNGFGLGYLFVLGLMFYLMAGAQRNIPFVALAALPPAGILLGNIFSWLGEKIGKGEEKQHKFPLAISIAVGLVVWAGLGSNHLRELIGSKHKYGLEADATSHPSGAAGYVKSNGVKGVCFSDYLSSSYFLWDLKPTFKTYIDLRDLDIFPGNFFDHYGRISYIPEEFEKEAESRKFDYIMLLRREFDALHDHLKTDSTYAIAFADAVSVVYLRKGGANDLLFQKIQSAPLARDVFAEIKPMPQGSLSYLISKIGYPLYHKSEYKDINNDYWAGVFYQKSHPEIALARVEKAMAHPTHGWQGSLLKASVLKMALPNAQGEEVAALQKEVQNLYRQAYDMASNEPEAISMYAESLLKAGKTGLAFEILEGALGKFSDNFNILYLLSECHKAFGQQNIGDKREHVTKWVEYMVKADFVSPNNMALRYQIGMGYCLLGDCQKAKPFIEGLANNPPQGVAPMDAEYVRKCMAGCR